MLIGNRLELFKPEKGLDELTARGPEGTRLLDINGLAHMGFTRLAINGLNPLGMQPWSSYGVHWMCNGEIYNSDALKEEHEIITVSGSDCEVIGHLYNKYADNLKSLFRSFDGVFAMAIVDEKRDRVIVARDPYGVRPLYMGIVNDLSGNIYTRIFASEMKALYPYCTTVSPILPGTYHTYSLKDATRLHIEQYHSISWLKNPIFTPAHPSGLDMACASLRFSLEEAVKKRLMTERPVAALLSGGVDSSLIASLVARQLRELGKPPLKTFCIGMPGSTDMKFAREVAKWIGSDHTEVLLTPDDFFNAIPKVIQDIESYDTTTVRASVGNWLVSREIKKQTECKVVFNGDGSDEIFGSYLYFFRAPTDREFEEESERLLKDIHMFDVLRSDRSISSHGLEPRTPFLDRQFVSVARSIATEWRRPTKQRCEKWILRRAFDDGVTLPPSVLWRKKEAFSDGVSSTEKSWFEEIKERVEDLVPENWKERAVVEWRAPQPTTKEQYFYRNIYYTWYGKQYEKTNVPYFWMPKWSPGTTDPSARLL
jgi:asparagine synthase (glutamine-hydrolysing)